MAKKVRSTMTVADVKVMLRQNSMAQEEVTPQEKPPLKPQGQSSPGPKASQGEAPPSTDDLKPGDSLTATVEESKSSVPGSVGLPKPREPKKE